MSLRSISRLSSATRLFLLVQRRAFFPHIYLGLSAYTVLMFHLFVPEKYWELILPTVMLGEYGSVGVLLVAAQRYLEMNERSTAALIVTPLESGEYLLAMNGAAALVATAAGVIVFGGVIGVDYRLPLFVVPLLLTASLAGLIGLVLTLYVRALTDAFLVMMPVIIVYSLPMASWFRLVPRYVFIWIPTDAALFSFGNLTSNTPSLPLYALYCALLLAYNAIGYWWARRLYQSRVRLYLEGAV